MGFINSLLGDNGGGILAGVLALVIVIALIVFLVWALKVLLDATAKVGRNNAKRISVSENFAIDQKHRLILIRRDNVEHLLLLGGTNELIIESNIIVEQVTNTKDKKAQNQKNMNKLGKKINDTLVKNGTKAVSGAAVGDVSLRKTGLLRRSGEEVHSINPQTFDDKAQNHGRIDDDSDIENSNADIFFIDEEEIKLRGSGKSGVAKTKKSKRK